MNLRKLLGLQKKPNENQPYPYEGILHLWEDDYLMLELIAYENLEFVKAETIRINDFAQEHFDGTSFTDITPIGEKPIKTIEKLIDIADVENIMTKAGLEKVSQFHMQGVGLVQGGKAQLGFGTNKFAIMCDKQSNLLQNIWVTGHTSNEEEKQKLIDALLLFGCTFNFIAVNWYRGEYYHLVERSSVVEFVTNSC
ncbi:MAG TPA: hypothetical protein VD993_02630 [Chitinophagaceae bacterium]|nr:hypothetical protein [Chitinophagaceae bacterium]